MLAHDREREHSDEMSRPNRWVAQPLGQGFGGAEVLEQARLFVERQQGIAQVEAQINGLCQRLVALGEMGQRRQRLLKIRHGLTVRRTRRRPLPGLPAIGQACPTARPASRGAPAVRPDRRGGRQRALDGLDNARMQHPPPLQEAPICHLVGQGVLEGVGQVGK